jgi:glycosyltransferase involved in cell wall biosynthesis
MKILVVANNFPDKIHPNNYVFIKKTTDGLLRLPDIDLRIIAPRPYYYRVNDNENYKDLIIRPYYFSLFARSKRFARILTPFNQYLFIRAISAGFRKLNFLPDVIYVHFLKTGICTIPLSKENDIPIVVGSGESSFSKFEQDYPLKKIKERLRHIHHFVALSDNIRQKIVNDYLVPEGKVTVLPNAVPGFFYELRKSRKELRGRYGFPDDAFIVCFLGHFVERKGPLRVLEAIVDLENVYGIFIGEGPHSPAGSKVLYCEKAIYPDVPDLLSCADVFVFPTTAEGSSNAIIEAMACGLPVIASDIPSIREQVSKENAILIDPMDTQKLRESILELKNNPTRLKKMGEHSAYLSKQFTLENRMTRLHETFYSVIINNR